MEKWLEKFVMLVEKYPSLNTLMLSIALVLFFYFMQKVIQLNLISKSFTQIEKNLLKKRISQYLRIILIICLLILWFSQLQFLIVSLFAVAAAIVIALKELIMCLTGGTLVNISHTFKEGDRIDIDGVRGFVIEKNLLTTKVLEIGPERNSQQTTGDIITIPNSLMLSKSLKNESYFKGYSIKSFVFKIENQSLAKEFEDSLFELAQKLAAKYIHEAKANISAFCEKENLVVPSVEPRTKIIIENGKDVAVLVKLPIANSDIANVEQEINRYYLDWKIKNNIPLSKSKEE
jgi:small-conductance mechanosensitive channel